MANRRTRRGGNPRLTVIEGGDDALRGSGRSELRELLETTGAPEEALRALDEGADPDEVLEGLVESGVLPSPEDSLTSLLDTWKPLLQGGCDPFSAELAGVEFMSMLRQAAPSSDEVPAILLALIAQAEEAGRPEALAMLRVLAVTGPPQARAIAAEAADRLVAAGLEDGPWVRGLGAPEVGACFGYGDEAGAQEAIAITFHYGRDSHAIATLIDHDLGGGVKDCWPTDRPDQIYDGYQQATRMYGLTLHEYDPVEAREILERALAQPPCPVEADQVEDVGTYLDLLQHRVALLPKAVAARTGADPRTGPGTRAGAGTGTGRGRPAGRGDVTIHRIKISLRGARPPIWRRLEVPSNITLQRLHVCIQAAFDWEGHHMWVFETPKGRYGVADRELGHRSATAKHLSDVAAGTGDRARYTYDFGDDWQHEILVEDVLAAEPGVAYPRCVAGRRAAPPEDCGGIWGYADLVEILADPAHPEHGERLEWLGLDSADRFDPARFDITAVNDALSGLARTLVKR